MHIHVFVLVHGKYGSPHDFDNFVKIFNQYLRTRKINYTILVSKINNGSTSYGIETGGEKLIVEMEHFFPELHQQYTKLYISVIGHSLGGLYLRNAMGSLYSKFPTKWNWIGFYSFCTPHLGSRRPQEQQSVWKKIIYSSIHQVLSTNSLFGQTGKDLLLEDFQREIPILVQMTLSDSKYMKALHAFQSCTSIMLTDGDVCVPYSSASILQVNNYDETAVESFWEWKFDCSGFQKAQLNYLMEHHHYHSIIPLASPPLDEQGYIHDSKQEVEFLPQMMINLQSIPWRRIALMVQSNSVMAKFKLHEWPIAKGTVKNRSGEFVNMIIQIICLDHRV